jgi:hypothetical protein
MGSGVRSTFLRPVTTITAFNRSALTNGCWSVDEQRATPIRTPTSTIQPEPYPAPSTLAMASKTSRRRGTVEPG